MTNWKNIHPDFTEELQEEWEDEGFSKEECKEWIDIGLEPENIELVAWLKNEAKQTTQQASNQSVKELKENYNDYLNWKKTLPNFNFKKIEKWKKTGFNHEQTKKWMDIGLKHNDVNYVQWLRDTKKLSAEWASGHKEELKTLRIEYKEIESSATKKQGGTGGFKEEISVENIKEQTNNLIPIIVLHQEEEKPTNIDNWEDVHPNFTSKLQKEWEDKGFDRDKCRKWINTGLKPKDAEFASYLYKQHTIPQRFLFSLKARGKIIETGVKEIDHFSTEFSSNCAIVISEENEGDEKKFVASLLIYDEIENIPWCIKFFSHSSYDETKTKSELLKEKLNNSDSPILTLLEVGNKPIYLPKTIKKTSILENNSENHLKKYDIIGIKTSESSVDYVAVFLGKNENNNEIEVVHFSDESNINWSVQIDNWENFLKKHQQRKEIISYRPIIPFKKYDLIQKHIEIVINKSKYKLGEYDLFAENNKYFATLCVGSIPFSKRFNKFFLLGRLKSGGLGEELLKKEVQRNNEYFTGLEKNKESKENLEEIIKKYHISLHERTLIQEKINEISDATSEEEVDILLEQLLSFKPSFHDNAIKENFRKAIKELVDKQKTHIKKSQKKIDFGNIVLLIGKTGNGKSTLANVLVNKEENFEEDGEFDEKFKESTGTISETKDTKAAEFEINSVKYQVVDTIGISDTELSEEEVLERLAKTAYSIRNGLYRLFFVVKGKFEESEIKAFELLKDSIFDNNITKYTTIVRTNFSEFEIETRCKNDLESLKKENKTISNIVESCDNKVVYVDNPPLNYGVFGKNRRKDSRKYLIDHLKVRGETYLPDKLYKLVIKISEFMSDLKGEEKKKEKLEEELTEGKNEGVMKITKQKIEEKKDMISTIKTEIYDKVRADLKEKGVYNKWLSEFVEKKIDANEIPYERFYSISENPIGKGGFSKVYKAKWKEKNHTTWVALKILNDSQNINIDFLKELTCHALTADADDFGKHIVRCHGVSQDPITNNYIMAMQYARDGNLREYLRKNHNRLSFKDKFTQLLSIAEGLNSIHERELIHRDFHPGNILIDYTYSFECYIADLGLCKPIDKENKKDKIYGVLPYVAPEVLRNKIYTQASDVYSFGIVTYEIFSKLPPYYDLPHEGNLAIKICQGLRPNLDNIKAPETLKNLIRQCWNDDSQKRPTAKYLKEILSGWYWNIIYEKKNTEFYKQYEEIRRSSKIFSETVSDLLPFSWKNHPQAIYTSRLLDFRNLPEPQKTQETSEQLRNSNNYNISKSVEFPMTEFQRILNEMNKQENDSQNWTTLHSSFTPELIQNWQENSFNHQQTQDWISIGLQPTEANFAAYLRDTKHLTPETALNQADYNQLKAEYEVYQEQLEVQQEQSPSYLKSKIEIPPKRN